MNGELAGATMTYRGHIQNGVAVLDTPANLPDGTPVRIEVDRGGSEFWQNKSASELAREQAAQPMRNLADLTGEWPTEDSIEDFLVFLREVRR
jgi:hypothetical protein